MHIWREELKRWVALGDSGKVLRNFIMYDIGFLFWCFDIFDVWTAKTYLSSYYIYSPINIVNTISPQIWQMKSSIILISFMKNNLLIHL